MSRRKYPTQELGARLAAMRHAAGLLQREVAARLFVAPSTVAQWETGRACPVVQDLDAYLRVVGGSITLGVRP
jgi:transcriptional regulator with XRE-family HTH domain